MPNKIELPPEEEYSFPEVPLTSASLISAGHHLGRQCDKANKEFMLCKAEEEDPRKCLREGKEVSRCAFAFFNQIRENCAESFTEYWTCVDNSQHDLYKCRKQQGVFDKCAFDKLGWVRPEMGDLNQVTVVKTERPKPVLDADVPTPEKSPKPQIPEDLKAPRLGSKVFFFS
ncbi:NADH dehydrogenase [ubiquinone] 1 alpha subcomplex subunit 8 [Holothuria leucospilota]|uniref:NADH dehydrogenase [ubiquinone] 1 alpha subcomplex subunit 8 n=1 Tax=Holothuria leucospilota TaxID=206669 RepID=A0A9Q1C076_HOLLE|nr:NADH dehydrogenase [ubiquinone] 1 alpha subcomplex subunit 8 [Holothuria leucospilota]